LLRGRLLAEAPRSAAACALGTVECEVVVKGKTASTRRVFQHGGAVALDGERLV